MIRQQSPQAIGLLYPGEMGTTLGKLLAADDHRVVTTLDSRGPRTCARCRAAGLEELDSLPAVVSAADVLLSLVPPGAALTVAQQCRDALIVDPPQSGRRLYIDLNSISPQTAHRIAEALAGTQLDFVNGAISGPASQLVDRGVVYLSGPRAAEAAAIFPTCLRVQVLGEQPGQASVMRMLLSGVAKGVVALFVEMAVAARQAGVLEQLLAAYEASYPGVMEMVERSLPTFPRHAARRAKEMEEVETTIAGLGLGPTVTPGIRRLIAEMGALWTDQDEGRVWSITAVIDNLHNRQFLAQARP